MKGVDICHKLPNIMKKNKIKIKLGKKYKSGRQETREIYVISKKSNYKLGYIFKDVQHPLALNREGYLLQAIDGKDLGRIFKSGSEDKYKGLRENYSDEIQSSSLNVVIKELLRPSIIKVGIKG